MKPTDFAKHISSYLTVFLSGEKGASHNTILSYRDTFALLVAFFTEVKNIRVEKLSLVHITKENIVEFLAWLQDKRKCCNATRNARLAAIHSFFKYLQSEGFEHLYECQRILSIRFRKQEKETIAYLSIEEVRLLLRQPDTTTTKGRRDLALLSLMYDTGARVQEIIDLTPSMLRLGHPATVKIVGKGNKARLVPLLDAQTEHLQRYLNEHQLSNPDAALQPIFFNSRKEKLTRAGINHILSKYCHAAGNSTELYMPKCVSCHTLRHSKAMHLLQAGVNLVYIRDILGHVSIQTTEIYARADSKQKRIALEKAYVDLHPSENPVWENNFNLITWLNSF